METTGPDREFDPMSPVVGAGQGGRAMGDQFDVTLEDPELLQEVELTTNLIIAASETDEHLSVEEIDRILGVTPGEQDA